MIMPNKPCIIVHGGAFNIPDSYVQRYKNGTQNAARAGYKVLTDGGSAVDAVEAAVKCLEDDSAFNAGHGAVLTSAGTVEMDAIIASGDTMKTGGVACVRDISNPISLARKVMEETPHCLLCGEGAMNFAKKMDVPLLDSMELITNDSVCKSFVISDETFDDHIQTYMNSIVNAKDEEDLEAFYKQLVQQGKTPSTEQGHDTVGAVAIDHEGKVACATSTGGMPGKMCGRIGDSPLFGCGAYANHYGACSSTGHGESLIRGTVCRDAIQYIEHGYSATEAAEKSLQKMMKYTDGRGGIILIDKNGNVGFSFSTSSMAWAQITPSGRTCGVREGDVEVFEVNN